MPARTLVPDPPNVTGRLDAPAAQAAGLTRRRLLQGAAFDPWRTWQPDGAATAEALVGAATLAANPHNTQPWRFRVTGDRIRLFGDPTRRTGAMDPLDRELRVGLGCALENLVLASWEAGLWTDVRVQPSGPDPGTAA